MLLFWRVYSFVVLSVLGVYTLIHSLGLKAAKELFSIGYGRRSKPS